MTDLEFLIAAVKDGKVPNLTFERDQLFVESPYVVVNVADVTQYHPIKVDWLCAAIRRALTKMGWYWNLSERQLSIVRSVPIRTMPKHFKEGTEFDWHLAAILYVIEQKEATA